MAYEDDEEAPRRRGRRKRREQTVRVVPEYPDERIGNFVRGLVVGALAGGVATLLNTRRSGAETRAWIQAWAEGLREGVADLAASARTAVKDAGAWRADDDVTWSQPVTSAEALTLAATPGGVTAEPADAAAPGSTLSEVAEQMEATPPTNVSHPGELTPPASAGPMPEEPMPVPDEASTTPLPRAPQA